MDWKNKIEEKYQNWGQDPETYLAGLYYSKPITYWDYIEVDTLLSLQKPRTHFPDELIFIGYHQVTEIVLRLAIHELQQLVQSEDVAIYEIKLPRIIRYLDLLISSFTVMNQGMDYDQYNQFRLALAPASGFQSAQFRYFELYCTDLEQLIHEDVRKNIPSNITIEEMFEYVYWQAAGKDFATGKKSLTLSLFEQKYLKSFIELAYQNRSINLHQKLIHFQKHNQLTDHLKSLFRSLDRKFNIEWPMVHLQAAHTYLGSGKEKKAATGGSHWEKYLHPKYQKRIFFPELYTEEELKNWGTES